jgi:hypothetical protein
VPELLPLTGIRGIAHATGYSLRALRSRCRALHSVRWACFAKAYSLGYSLPEIGRFFHKDHTTVLHGIRRHLGMSATQWKDGGPVPALSSLLMADNNGPEAVEALHGALVRQARILWRGGQDTKQIADRLGVAESAVYNSLANNNPKGRNHARLDSRDGNTSQGTTR